VHHACPGSVPFAPSQRTRFQCFSEFRLVVFERPRVPMYIRHLCVVSVFPSDARAVYPVEKKECCQTFGPRFAEKHPDLPRPGVSSLSSHACKYHICSSNCSLHPLCQAKMPLLGYMRRASESYEYTSQKAASNFETLVAFLFAYVVGRVLIPFPLLLSLTTQFASPPVGRHKMSQKVTHGHPKVFKSRSVAWPSRA